MAMKAQTGDCVSNKGAKGGAMQGLKAQAAGDGGAVEGLTEVPESFVLPSQFRRPIAAPAISIPIIDLAHLDDPDVPRQIHRACCDWGFFQVLNHGVSLPALHALRARLHQFFSLPLSAKRELGLSIGDSGQGFGSGFVDPKSGTAEWKDYLTFHTYPASCRDYSKWPPSLREDAEMVGGQMLALARQLLGICSRNLGLESSSIEDAMNVLHQKLLIPHYPACPQPELAMGSCEHTDVGVITCLWQASEDVVALQVFKDGHWHSVEPYPGAIVVNVGDQIEIFSNGLYKSGLHRVVLNSTQSRLSVIAFHNPSADAVVFPAKALTDKPGYHPTLFKDYAKKYNIVAV